MELNELKIRAYDLEQEAKPIQDFLQRLQITADEKQFELRKILVERAEVERQIAEASKPEPEAE